MSLIRHVRYRCNDGRTPEVEKIDIIEALLWAALAIASDRHVVDRLAELGSAAPLPTVTVDLVHLDPETGEDFPQRRVFEYHFEGKPKGAKAP